MPPTNQQQTTVTVFLRLKEGVKLDENSAGDESQAAAKQAFGELLDVVRAQRGFVRQYWGPQVENPSIFVWCIDWETPAYWDEFNGSETHDSFVKSTAFHQVFDLSDGPPVNVYVEWPSIDRDIALKAFESPVTEYAFYTMPEGVSEAEMEKMEQDRTTLELVQSVGKASGAAIGWGRTPSLPGRVLLVGAFGYASIDVHMAWKKTAECAKIVEPKEDDLDIRVMDFPGVDPNEGYFHVHFSSTL